MFAMLPVRGLRSQCGVKHDATAVVERVEGFFASRWSREVILRGAMRQNPFG